MVKNYDITDIKATVANLRITCNREKRDKVTLEEIIKMLKIFDFPTSSVEKNLDIACRAGYIAKEDSYYFCTKSAKRFA